MSPENDRSEQRSPPDGARRSLHAVPEGDESSPGSAAMYVRQSPGGLPAALTSFVGREREVAEIGRLLMENRLVTLCGPGGSGKTRLAMSAARSAAGGFEDGAGWVWLAPLSDGGLVSRTVAAALGLDETPGRSPVGSLVEHFERREALLVLDNCEHLVGACAELVGILLGSCPRLRVLATSREPLGVEGEMRRLVPPLSLPGAGEFGVGGAECSEAVRLFVERANQRVPGFALTPRNTDAITDICVKLEGVPLAIELAAARVGTLSVAQISARLDDSLRLLSTGPRTAEPRQKTLRGALDWSYELLSEDEKTVFRRLSVFSGGWTLEAAEAVCSEDGVGEYEILDLLGALVDKSLVVAAERDGDVRHRMLATVRQYALEKFHESGEGEAVRRRHALFFLELAEEAGLTGAGQGAWVERLEAELDNLRAALGWYASRDESEGSLRLAGALWWFWYLRGHYVEGRGWLEGALAKGRDSSHIYRAKALVAAGDLAFLLSEYSPAKERLEAGLVLYRDLGDRRGIASAVQLLGSIAREQGRYDEAEAFHEESLSLSRERGDDWGVAQSLNHLGFVAWLGEDFERATELCMRASSMFRVLEDEEEIAWAAIMLGAASLYRGDHPRASALFEEGLAAARGGGHGENVAWALDLSGVVARREGRSADAESLLRESLSTHRDLGDRWRSASLFEGLAGCAAALEAPERAALLFGAAEALRGDLSDPVPPCERGDLERGVSAARAGMDGAAFRAAWSAGGDMSLERVYEYALESSPEAPAAPRRRAAESPLSERETEVLSLVAEGMTDVQIAERLYLSRRTVGHHLSAVYRKLGVPSRAAAVREADERGWI